MRRNKAQLRPLPGIQAPPPAVEDTEQAAGPEEGEGAGERYYFKTEDKQCAKAAVW